MLSLRPPPVAVALDHGEPDTQTVYLDLKLASIHGQLNALVLCLCELGPKLGIIGRQGQQEQGGRKLLASEGSSRSWASPMRVSVDLTAPPGRHAMSGRVSLARVVSRHQERSPPRDRP